MPEDEKREINSIDENFKKGKGSYASGNNSPLSEKDVDDRDPANESKKLDNLENLPKHRCRLEVPDIQTLLRSNTEMWYICREPKDSISDYFSDFGERIKTVEDSQYKITYFNDKNKWLCTIYADKSLSK